MKTSKENSSNRRVKPMVRFFLRYLREIAFHRGLPFAVRIPNETTLKAIHEVEQGTDLQGYSDLDEMFQELGLSQFTK